MKIKELKEQLSIKKEEKKSIELVIELNKKTKN